TKALWSARSIALPWQVPSARDGHRRSYTDTTAPLWRLVRQRSRSEFGGVSWPTADKIEPRRQRQEAHLPSLGREVDVQFLPQCLRPLVQRRQRGVEHLAGFQARQRGRVDPHPLGHGGQRQTLTLAHRFETGQQTQSGGKTLLADGARRPLADGVGRVLAPNRLLSRPLLRRSLRPGGWLHLFLLKSLRKKGVWNPR